VTGKSARSDPIDECVRGDSLVQLKADEGEIRGLTSEFHKLLTKFRYQNKIANRKTKGIDAFAT
jgi:hypothetical protein